MKHYIATVFLAVALLVSGCASAPPAAPAATAPAATAPAATAPAATAPAEQATPAQAPTAAAETKPATGMVTASGFACPAPMTPVNVTSKQLNLFVWTEYIPDDIIECFEKVYGVTVNRDEYSSNEEMYAKLAAGGANYDLVQPSDYFVGLMVKQGLLAKIDKSKLAVLGNFDPSYLNLPFDPNNEYTVPYEAGSDAIVVNTDKVKQAPTSFADLWNPDYAGRIVLPDDSRTVIGLTLLTLGYDPNTKDTKQLEEAKARLAKLVPAVKLFDSDSPKTALIGGDVDLGVVFTGEAVEAARQNPAFHYVYPKEGAFLWQDNWAMPAAAPHADAAYAWLNYTLQDDLFWLMLRDFPYINPNRAALDYAKTQQSDLYQQYMSSNATNIPADAIANGKRLVDVGDATPLYDRIWTEVKGE